ncbi:MAG TPA: DNA primase, partial [Candidatus Pseudomonas excrementavium]|nr:DNA primase [Candidatus Pseudomonas excrementavium]
LRRLLRQSLEARTGMDLDSLPAAPPAEPTSAPPMEPGYDAWDGYEHQYDEMPEWSDQPTATRPSRPQRQPQRQRDTSSVESPVMSATRTLLHHPHLAGLAKQASQLANEDDEEAQLLIALIDTLQKNPQLSTIELLARWHGTALGEQLNRLAEKEWILNIASANLEQQFFDTITTLMARQTDRQIQHLLDKSAVTSLTAEEKQQLRELLGRRHTPTAEN